MVKKYKKFILKMPENYRDKLEELEENILNNSNLEDYDIKPYLGFENQYRVRIWNYRIIFEKQENWNKILQINKRWDIYK